MKSYAFHTIRTVPNSNRQIAERAQVDAPIKQIHDHSLSWLGTVNRKNP